MSKELHDFLVTMIVVVAFAGVTAFTITWWLYKRNEKQERDEPIE